MALDFANEMPLSQQILGGVMVLTLGGAGLYFGSWAP